MIDGRCCEFPSIHPANVGHPYRYLYIGAAHANTGNAPLQALLKIDLESGERQLWSAAPCGFVGEPIFVPRPDSEKEDAGWILALVYHAAHHRSDLVILDAGDFSKGAMSDDKSLLSETLRERAYARLHLKHHIPYGLHGSFTSEVFVKV